MMDLERQIDVFSQRLAKDPHARIFAPLADLLRQAGRLDEALDLLDDGLGRHPRYVSALVIKGRTLLDAQRVPEARVVLDQALELDPENFVVLRLLTEEARSRQAWTEAIPLLEKLVVLDPDDQRWSGALSEARRLNKPEPAATPTDAADQADSDASFATMTLVDIYLAQGYRDKALAALRQMAAREPGRPDILERLAEIKAAGPEAGAPAGPPAAPSRFGLPGSLRPADPSARRVDEKKQFTDWIEKIRPDGNGNP